MKFKVPLLLMCLCAAWAPASEIRDTQQAQPLVLDEPDGDYQLFNVQVVQLQNADAITLVGRLHSVFMSNCRFGQVTSGSDGGGSALKAHEAYVMSFTAADCQFFDAESSLASLSNGSFGTVTFQRCTFRVSEEFMQKVQRANPWRTTTPMIELANIDRVELLDNEFADTRVIIHPSVRQVVVRGDIANLQIRGERTQLLVLPPG